MDLSGLEERYQPAVIEAYATESTPGQTMEEWLMLEGSHMYAASEIYKPMNVSVCIQGRSNNVFAVDTTSPDWYRQFVTAVKDTLVGAGIAKERDEVNLTSVTGQPITERTTMHEIQQVGTIYPSVNGERVGIDSRSRSLPQVRTPASHAVNKPELLENWAKSVCEKSADVIAAGIAGCKNIDELEEALSSPALAKDLATMVKSHVDHLPSFAKTVEVHGDPSLKSDILNGHLSHDDIAREIAECILDGVAASFGQRNQDVEAFYENQKIKSMPAPVAASSSPVSVEGGRRTIRSKVSSPETNAAAFDPRKNLNLAIESLYPTEKKLHRVLLGEALLGQGAEEIQGHMIMCVKAGNRHGHYKKHRRGRKNPGRYGRHQHHHDEDDHGHGHHHHGEEMRGRIHHRRHGHHHHGENPRSHRHARLRSQMNPTGESDAVVGSVSDYRDMLGEERYMAAIRRKDELAMLPPAPGVVSLGRSSSSSSNVKAKIGRPIPPMEYVGSPYPANQSELLDKFQREERASKEEKAEIMKRRLRDRERMRRELGSYPDEPVEQSLPETEAYTQREGGGDDEEDYEMEEPPSMEIVSRESVPSMEYVSRKADVPSMEYVSRNPPARVPIGKAIREEPPSVEMIQRRRPDPVASAIDREHAVLASFVKATPAAAPVASFIKTTPPPPKMVSRRGRDAQPQQSSQALSSLPSLDGLFAK